MDLSELEARTGVRFCDQTLLLQAMTHKTYAREHATTSYERLEFLGDSVLNFIVGEYLYAHVRDDEGKLTKRRAALVCARSLRQAGEALGLNQFLLMGEELSRDNRFRMHVDDLYESLVAAIYLDQGLDLARNFVVRTLLEQDISGGPDYKSALQERMQKHYRDNVIRYETREINAEATHDEDRFEATVFVSGKCRGSGRGRNKKSAENEAAKHLYEDLDRG